MSLAGRLGAFFLAALALVLAGFSLTLYLLADAHLHGQADERLAAALDVLAAAAEVKPDGVEWEPQERVLGVGQDADVGQVRWTVRDDQGRAVGRSRNLGAEDPFAGLAAGDAGALDFRRDGRAWRLRQVRLQAAAPAAQRRGQHGSQHQEGNQHDDESRHEALVLTAGVCLEPVENTLRTLALALTGLSAGLWLLAALAGRRLCRRALLPLAGMASAARAMGAARLSQRLPAAGTGDELEDLGLAFNGLLARLEEAFERQRRFTGDASHQLRSPLAAVLGQIEVALLRDRPAEEYRHTLRLVHGQAVRLRQIVEALLFLARADADAALPRLDTVELAAWLGDYAGGWAGHPRAADLRRDFPPGPLWAGVHGPLLGQLLDNLLDNACKYSPPGAPITLRLARDGGEVVVAVEDVGGGIDPADLPHVFQPFYRAPAARLRGRAGVGLGLAVARRIAAALNGTIHAASAPGRGSTFTLRLPANEATPGARQETQPIT